MIIRFLNFSIVVKVWLPEACCSVTCSQRCKFVRIHLDGEWGDDGVILLVDALSRGQANDSGSNHCDPHVWATGMREHVRDTHTHSENEFSKLEFGNGLLFRRTDNWCIVQVVM